VLSRRGEEKRGGGGGEIVLTDQRKGGGVISLQFSWEEETTCNLFEGEKRRGVPSTGEGKRFPSPMGSRKKKGPTEKGIVRGDSRFLDMVNKGLIG